MTFSWLFILSELIVTACDLILSGLNCFCFGTVRMCRFEGRLERIGFPVSYSIVSKVLIEAKAGVWVSTVGA